MDNKKFFAQQWLQKEESVLEKSRATSSAAPVYPGQAKFPSFQPRIDQRPTTPLTDDSKFSPLDCFVPGWKGESLNSKITLKFEQLLATVQNDVKAELLKNKDFPRTIKLGLYSEFLSYAECFGLHFDELDDMSKFWQLLNEDSLKKHENLNNFIEIYVGRVATITFMKLRFISTLLNKCGIELNDKALLYPTSFLSQIFKKGSQTELVSRALESNHYSWYRPSENMKAVMKELLTISKDLAITEITKNVSKRTQAKPSETSRVYSHALSHVSLGLFLNSLQINFPLWIDTVENKTTFKPNDDEEIISCKFYGDYLESLALSHWLAQENNKHLKWDQILCSDFKGFEFTTGLFAKICNELQFLTFLVHKAEHQQERPIEYICRTMSRHFNNRKNTVGKQTSLLDENPFYCSTYDRVVLNLCNFPKNNPQHYLMNQIMEQVNFLKPEGYLFVLSSKKLFVPSLRERLEPILKELKVEAIFDLDNVKGKGELGNYVYVFRKRQQTDSSAKQLCSYFRISADLNTFQEFSPITEHLRSFYLSNLTEIPPMAQAEFKDNFRLEFFQEALVNGMLIHSTSEDSSRITHPNFFKGLLKSCVPLDTIFEIKALNLEEKINSTDNHLNLGLKKDISYFLVVDFRSNEVKLELHPTDTFRSIYSEYGITLCSYFELLPKFVGLNPNILRSYFTSPIGKQVTNLTFTAGPNRVKGSLSKLLVPKFLTQTEALPNHLKTALSFFDKEENEILKFDPATISKSFKHVNQIAQDLIPKYACEILTHFANFERTLSSMIWKINDSRSGHKFSFSNVLIQTKLVEKPTRPLYPSNEDIFFEMAQNCSPQDIHKPLTQVAVKVSSQGDLKLYSLDLISNSQVIVKLHGEESIIMFVQFLLDHVKDIAISKVMKAVHIPSFQDLNQVIESTQELKATYSEMLDAVQISMSNAFRLQISSK